MKSWRLGAALLCLVAVGCGGADEDKITLVPVTGKVTLDGKPLEGVIITFVPDGSNPVKTDGGEVTGDGGAFEAKYRNRNGLAPGKYKVVVGRPGSGPSKTGKPLDADIAKSSYMAGLATASGPGKSGPAPWPYETADKTPLTHEVSPKGDTDLVFTLKSTLK